MPIFFSFIDIRAKADVHAHTLGTEYSLSTYVLIQEGKKKKKFPEPSSQEMRNCGVEDRLGARTTKLAP